VITAMIMPMTAAGGPPGGRPKKNTKMNRPIPAVVPMPIPPSLAPTAMHASRTRISAQIMVVISSTPGPRHHVDFARHHA
jgi:hypothetical protein